ncbi:MAG: hypothetical protein KF723_15620 [Rhizobiaceae bacterium]|nr:hypothetical protein [Rhizobiaceae bacterium]
MFFRPRRKEAPAMTLEGVLGQNSRLDEADGMRVDTPDAVCVLPDGRLLFGSGARIFALDRWGAEPVLWASTERPVSALFASAGGRVGVGLEDGRLSVFSAAAGHLADWPAVTGLGAVSDGVFLAEDEIAVLDTGYGPGEPVLALAPWDDEARGRIVRVRPNGRQDVVRGGLHCPMGLCLDAGGGLVVSQLERASLVDANGKVLQAGYPGYLGRVRRSPTGFVMACLSRRDPLIEFLKTEPDFVAEMKAKIDPRHWIAPRATPEFSHDVPIELGASRLFGEVKPWAPSFSYGLVIELDDRLMPVASAHSRANGTRHAISDVATWNGALVAVSRASGELLRLDAGRAPS